MSACEAAERRREEALRKPKPLTLAQIQAAISRVRTAYERYLAGEVAEASAFRMPHTESPNTCTYP